jgi:hypothetical protein
VSHELDDDNSFRTGVRDDSGSDAGSVPIERKYNWTVVVHSVLPCFEPWPRNSLQSVDEQHFGHERSWRRSYRVIVSFIDFKF